MPNFLETIFLQVQRLRGARRFGGVRGEADLFRHGKELFEKVQECPRLPRVRGIQPGDRCALLGANSHLVDPPLHDDIEPDPVRVFACGEPIWCRCGQLPICRWTLPLAGFRRVEPFMTATVFISGSASMRMGAISKAHAHTSARC